MGRIFTVGETTYDIVFSNNQPIKAIIGGSALNTSITLGRLNLPLSFISRIAEDHIGELSIKFLLGNNIDCSNIVRYNGKSRLSVAFLDSENNAEYQFYGPSNPPSLLFPNVFNDDIIHFGSSNSLIDDGREKLLDFLIHAKGKGSIIIYDPNIRKSDDSVIKKAEEYFRLSDIVKASVEDFKILYGISDCNEIFNKLKSFGVNTLIITNSKKPISLFTSRFEKEYDVKVVDVVSSIGAGDNFSAGILASLNINNINLKIIPDLNEAFWDKAINLSMTLSSKVCQSEINYISKEFGETLMIKR